jgi:NAD(P)-dependent dehydrogenase (short-subunit alcohol dehydrogenase family)
VGQQRVIAITGVSRGLGRAMVKQFVERGHLVCGCARSADAIKRLSRQFGPPHQFDTLDVSDDAQVQVWCERILSAAHAPDLLLNNAGLINRPAPLWKTPPEEFQGIIDVNIRGVYHVARHFLPGMIERGVGVLVNFTSTWGRSTSPEVAPYCCSKWAIEGLTRSLADELPAGLAAIPFNPGIHQHGDAEDLFWGQRRSLSVGGSMGVANRTVFAAAFLSRQWAAFDGSQLNRLPPITACPCRCESI